MSKRTHTSENGFILPMLIAAMLAVSILMVAAFEVINANFSTANTNNDSQRAFNIAEAGINYYLWHLSHSSTDYKDGGTTPTTPDPTLGYGPYVHNYLDQNAVSEGTYTLWVNPPSSSTTVVTVRSTGTVNGTNTKRTIQAQIGAPSFSSYAVASDTALWFGNDESATGPVHSNQGVRMDGPNSTDVTSANSTYVPAVGPGGDGFTSHPGVWCSNSVTTPVNCSTRDKSDWRYPVPQVDFNQVATSLCTMKKTAFLSDSTTSALAGGANACTQTPTTRTAAYLPQRSTTGTYSNTKGYLIQLNPDDTYDLFQVNAENDRLTPYTSALTLASVQTGIPVPTSGVIFAEDNVWVRTNPTFHGRVTIAAGRLASTNNAQINIADDLVYSTKNGADTIGLVAEDSVILTPYAPPATGNFNFEVDAATIAQSGTVTYPGMYKSNPSVCTRGWTNPSQQFTFYGSVATRQTWTWTWQNSGFNCGDQAFDSTNGYISGVENNNTQYDYNLEYAPPPNFPVTSSFNILSWREELPGP